MNTFSTVDLFVVIILAALVQASFQLSVSVLTLLNGHALGAKTAQKKVLRLTTSFVTGAGIMTVLTLSFVSLLFNAFFGTTAPQLVWVIVCGVLLGLGVAVWLFYYRRGTKAETGTSLWIPRSFARFLSERSRSTKRSAEAFSLGLISVLSELLFLIGPIVITALVLIHLDPLRQLIGIVIYGLVSTLSLIIVWALLSGGLKVSKIQQWRTAHKKFLQFSAGGGMLVLGFYVYVDQVMTVTAYAQGSF